MSRPVYITLTGDVGDANGGVVRKVILTPAAAVATLVLREKGSGGAIIAAFQAAASGNSFQGDFNEDDSEGGLIYSDQLHATLVGVGAVATIAF